jgi:hypothetical protein
MRTLICILFLLPILASAQVNRSANELAQETTKDYVQKKLFKGQPYTPISYSEIKSYRDKKDLEVEWMIEHRFEITRPPNMYDKNPASTNQPYRFIFYLDHQMKVKRAESYHHHILNHFTTKVSQPS